MNRRDLFRILAGAAGAVAFAGCGIPVDDQPRDIPPGDRPGATERPIEPTAPADALGPQVYFLSAPRSGGTERLQPASRTVSPTLPAVLQALLAGPSAEEQARRVRTAVPSGTRVLGTRIAENGTATIDLDRAFDQSQGDAQRKAVAQVVFTATGVEGVEAVQLLVEGRPREWPRGDGFFQREPLTRSAYPDLDPTSQPEFPPAPSATSVSSTPTTAA